MQLQGFLPSMSHFPPPPGGVCWEMQQSKEAHLGSLLAFPESLLQRKMEFQSRNTNDLVIPFPLGFSSLLMNINDSLHISLFLDFFLCSVFSSLVWALLGFVQLLLYSRKSVLHTHLLYLFYLLLFCLSHSLFWPFLLNLLILLSTIFCLFLWSSHSFLTLLF